MNLESYAKKTGLSEQFLRGLGLSDYSHPDGTFVLEIPYYNEKGKFFRMRLRQGSKRWWGPGEGTTAYGLNWLENDSPYLILVEGESDSQTLLYHKIPVLGIPGALTFKPEWSGYLGNCEVVYLCEDNDQGAGKLFTQGTAEKLCEGGFKGEIRIIKFPDDVKDINEFFLKTGGRFKEFFGDLLTNAETVSQPKPEFKPLSSGELAKILGLTIRRDETNKVATFLCQLSAYTEDSQLNVSFNAPSSTGKTYIPLEIAQLFPGEDVIVVGYCSPTAFFHDIGKFDEEKQGYIVDLSRKILIFLDQPHTLLLQHLRPFLSHDKKEIRLKITDKSQKRGLRTKNIYLRGYPAVIFCTAGLRIDEQESTRFLLLSPETSQEKIREAIFQRIQKESDPESWLNWLESDPQRKLLRQRILSIKEEKIKDIKIGYPSKVEAKFFSKRKILKPRHSRDIARIISLIKCFALLNLWFREREGSALIASQEDVEEGFKIWDEIAESQELNIPPYINHFYQDIILPAYEARPAGLSRRDILRAHLDIYGRTVSDQQLRKEIIPMLDVAGLITEESDPLDKRKKLIYPTLQTTISLGENNSGTRGGVNQENGLDQQSDDTEATEGNEGNDVRKASSEKLFSDDPSTGKHLPIEEGL